MNIVDLIPVNNRTKSQTGKNAVSNGKQTKSQSEETDPVNIVSNLLKKENNNKKKQKEDFSDEKDKNNFKNNNRRNKKKEKYNREVELEVENLVVVEDYTGCGQKREFDKVRVLDMCNSIDVQMFSGGSVVYEYVHNNKKYKTVAHKSENLFSSVEEDVFMYSNGEKVFEDPVYKGNSLPKWFLKITVEELPVILHTLGKLYIEKGFEKISKCNNEEDVRKSKRRKHVVMNENMRESYRQHKLVMTAFHERKPETKRLVKEYLYCVFKTQDAEFSVAICSKKAPHDYVGCQMPQIYVDDFDSKSCLPKREASQIKISSVPNFLFAKAESTSRNNAFTAGSFKKRLREFVQQNYEVILWRHYLEKHMPLPETFEKFMSNDYVMWWKNFIPVEFYYLTTTDWHRFYVLLHVRLSNLRKRMYDYAERYYRISKLSHYETVNLFSKRKEMFSKLMKAPRAQSLFMSGRSHSEVSAIIYEECTNSINVEIDRILKIRNENETFESQRVDDVEDEFFCIPERDTCSVRQISKKKSVRKICSYVENLRKPTLEKIFLEPEEWDRNEVFGVWLKRRQDYNQTIYVEDYEPIRVTHFYECDNFESFLLKRKYIENLSCRIFKFRSRKALRLESKPDDSLEDVDLNELPDYEEMKKRNAVFKKKPKKAKIVRIKDFNLKPKVPCAGNLKADPVTTGFTYANASIHKTFQDPSRSEVWHHIQEAGGQDIPFSDCVKGKVSLRELLKDEVTCMSSVCDSLGTRSFTDPNYFSTKNAFVASTDNSGIQRFGFWTTIGLKLGFWLRGLWVCIYPLFFFVTFIYLKLSGLLSSICSFSNFIRNNIGTYMNFMRHYDSAVDKIERVRELMDVKVGRLLDFDLTPGDRLRLIEMNSLVHIFMNLKNDNKAAALAWSSNFIITRYNNLPQFLRFLNEYKFEVAGSLAMTMGVVAYNNYCLEIGTYKSLCESYDNGLETVDEFCETNKTEIFETQSGQIANFLKPFVSMFVGKEVKKLSVFEIRDLNQQWQLANHMSRHYESVVDNLSVVIAFLLRLIFGYDPSDVMQQDFVNDMLSHMEYFKNTSFRHIEIKSNRQEMAIVLMKYETAVSLRKNPRFSGVPGHMAIYYDRLLSEFSLFAKECNTLICYNTIRKEPIVVLFTGPPSTGKSTSCNFLQQALSVMIKKEQYNPTMTYTFNKKSDFWEGYNNNMFVLMDDLFSSSDVADRRIESLALIGMVNTAPYNLPMAFESKGTMFFESDFIFASTNLANNGIKKAIFEIGVTDNKAVARRFHWVLHATKKYKGEGVRTLSFRVDAAPETYSRYVGENVSLIEFVKILNEQYKNTEEPHVLSIEEVCDLLGMDLHIPQNPHDDGFIHDDLDDVEEVEDFEHESKKTEEEEIPAWVRNDENILEGTKTLLTQRQITFFEKYYKVFIADNSESIFVGAKYAAYLFAILLTAYGAYSLYNIMSPKEMEIESKNKKYAESSAKKGLTNKMKVAAAKVRKFKRFRQMKHKPIFYGYGKKVSLQSSSDNFEQAALKAAKGTVFLYFCAKDETGNILYRETSVGFHLKNGVLMTVAHAILKFEEYEHVELYMKYNNKIHELDVDNILLVEGEDACFLKMPEGINKPPEMYKYLASREQNYHMHDGMPMMLVTSNEAGQPVFKGVNKISGPDKMCEYCVSGNNIIVESPIYYSGYTAQGDSGSMLFMPSIQGSPILVGMHLGCQDVMLTSYRVSLPIWKEYLDQVLTGFETQSCSFPLDVLYEVEYDKAFHHPKKSKIKRSKLYGIFGPATFVPAHLSEFKNVEGEIVDPALNGLLKFKQEDFQAEIPIQTMSYLMNLYPRSDFRNLFSYDESVNGVQQIGVPSIKVSTSAGYPYCLNAKKGKSSYIEFDGEKFVIDDTFLEIVKDYESELRKGNQIDVIWADVLKDETRTIEKVNAGKTRLFSTCPLHFLFLCRRYFGSFVGEVQRHSVTKPVAVGINPHSLDWMRLYHRLASVGDNELQEISIIAGDFESYDTTLCSALGKFFVAFVNKWYDDDDVNKRVRELLFEHVYNAKHIFGNKVYQLAMGNPSGNPLTAIYNSFCNIIATYTVLVHKMNIREDEIQFTVYGDDNVIAIGRKGIRCSDLTPHYLSCFGLKYTHFSKVSLENEPHDTLESIRYLGRKFVRTESIMRAPLEERVIMEMVYWIRGSNAEEEKFLSTIEAYFIEMSHFGEEKFAYYKDLLLKEVKKRVPNLFSTVSRNSKSYWFYHEGMYVNGKQVKFLWFESKNHAALDLNFDEVFFSSSTFTTHSAKCAVRLESEIHPSKEVKLLCRNIPVSFEVNQNNEEDRETNLAVETQEGRIGSFADVSTLNHSMANLGSVLQAPLNFEEYTVDQTLERTYQLATIVWNESQATSVELANFIFPKALFAQEFIAQRIKDYYYFKGTIRLSMRLSASKYVYGQLLASANPFPLNSAHDTNVFRSSGLPHVILSASESSTVVLDIPFINNKRALIIPNHDGSEMARVKIRVLAPLRNTDGTTASATLTVFAQFLDVKLALPFSFTPESNSSKEADLKGKMASISSKFESHVSNPLKIMRQKIDKQVSPFLETAEKIGKVAGTIATVASLVGLNKPVTTDRTSSITVIPDLDMMSGNGISHAVKVGYDVDNGVSTAPICGFEGDEMNLLNIVSVPMISGVFTLINGTEPLPICPAGPQIDFSGPFKINYVDWVCSQFLYVSGSFKYKIYIAAGLFQAIRLVFYLCPDQYDSTEWENCYHKVVDVQGDTEVEFKLPYMNPYVAESTRLPTQTPCVWVRILGWSTPNPSVPAPITLTVYKAGDKDMQFGCPLEKYVKLESNPRADFAQDFEFMDFHMKNYKHQGVLFGETIESIRDLIHRLAPQYTVAPNANFRPYLTSGVGSTPGNYYHLEMWGVLFKFYRGSIRLAIHGKKNTAVSAMTIKLPSYPGYAEMWLPFAKMSDKNQGLMQIEIPWYSDKPYQPTIPSTYNNEGFPVEVRYSSVETAFLFKGAGDDFSFGYLMPPLTAPLPAPSSYGAQALSAFYGSA
ncbi:hypothetical protein [Changjiang crawfish virus 4]|uniref:hypothetical protein n=1 Tax=Changjiang crawfish virus 4 TaxID=1922768 RepID=UPI00090A8824|nr:hypothetical protein [Changjiang crawfish virus 4]APG77911.1 hypothetical protein [Changjiang crawfish virus 4]